MPKTKFQYNEDYTKDQPNPLDTYLKKEGYSRRKFALETGIPATTLQHVARRKVENMEGKYYIALGNVIKKQPSTVFRELLKVQAEIDNELNQ